MCPSPAEGRAGQPVLFVSHGKSKPLKRQKQKPELKVCVCEREGQRKRWRGGGGGGVREGGCKGTPGD